MESSHLWDELFLGPDDIEVEKTTVQAQQRDAHPTQSKQVSDPDISQRGWVKGLHMRGCSLLEFTPLANHDFLV